MSKIFPIKTETACLPKWTWNTLNLYSGQTKSCCKVNSTLITPESFDSFHNHETNIQDREMMLRGERPGNGCEVCWQAEDQGKVSWRQFHNKSSYLIPPELEQDPTATHVTPRLLDIFFSNACNLKCLYCNDSWSSQIQHELNIHGEFKQDGVVISKHHESLPSYGDQLTDKFWGWLEKNYTHLRRIQILGGEPFFQKDLIKMIDFLEKHDNKDLEFEIISNLAVDTDRIQSVIYRIKKLIAKRQIKRLEILASIDCWGSEQEYVRQNLNLEIWKKNFEYVASEKWITLNISQVITSLTIKTIPQMLEYVNMLKLKYNRKIGHYHGLPFQTHSFLSPLILGNKHLENIIKPTLALMEDSDQKEIMSGLPNQSKDVNINELKKLSIFLEEMDRRRNNNWKETFPWLVDIMEEHNVV